jgi:predicted nucleic acid-binding protein
LILYLDSSALVKLYIDEVGSGRVRQAAGEARRLATSVVTIPEMISALGRRVREGSLGDEEARRGYDLFERELPTFLTVEATVELAEHAGRLVRVHGLRGFDAVQLASALAVVSLITQDSVVFAAADHQLRAAARHEDLTALEPVR